jgi:hypothetical protein
MGEKPNEERVKPFNFLGHPLALSFTTLSDGCGSRDFCLVAPAGEPGRFVDRHAPAWGSFEVGVDFLPRTYAELIELHDSHPERKYAGVDGEPYTARTRGVLHDLPVRFRHIKHVAKEGNELDDHLESPKIIKPLLSADFMASKYCYGKELRRALKRHDAGEAIVVHIVLRPFDWHGEPIARLQMLPEGGRPVAE